VAAAVHLFTVQPPEIVTVADIADLAGMTSAAFYYHFPSKELLLEEFVRAFADRWVEAVTSRLRSVPDAEHLGDFTDGVLDWVQENQSEAVVFFTSAVGATAGVDTCRGETRNRIIAATTEAVRRLAPSRTPAKVEASAVALYVLIATAVASLLTTDEVFRTLGPSKFRREVEQLAHNIIGPRRPTTAKAQRKKT
jgi:AcrR family transcriptional regulator